MKDMAKQMTGMIGMLDSTTIPKYKQDLKYALETTPGIKTYQGTTYRWQRGGTFSDIFKDVKVGDTITDKSFVSTSSEIMGAEYFRQDLNKMYRASGNPPELVVIKSKNGKIIPKHLAGSRFSEKEILHNADTQYRYMGTKDITSSDELGLTDYINGAKARHIAFVDFVPCKAIYLEEI